METRIDYFIFEREDANPKIDIEAISKSGAMVFITIADAKDALPYLEKGKEAALEAISAWVPKELEDPQQKTREHFVYCSKSVEKMDADAEEFKASNAGQRFERKLENARNFTLSHDGGRGLFSSEIMYLSDKHHNNFINGCFDVFSLGYRYGFNRGKKANAAAVTK